MGRAFKELKLRRESLVVSTKLIMCGSGINDKGLSRKHLMEGIANSLKRLQMDYVDVLFCHRPDPDTPLEETCRAMHDIIQSNRAFYWGTSEWPAQRIQEAIGICDKHDWHKPCVEQPQYNMLVRNRFESEYAPIFANGYGTTIWSPLCQGLLTGKYNDGNAPDQSRMANDEIISNPMTWDKLFSDRRKDQTITLFEKLAKLAKNIGCT